jgi:hypothetical protein
MGSRETPIQKGVLDYLKLKGHHVFRVNTQGVPLHGKGFEGRFRPSPMKGVSDLIGCCGRSHKDKGRFFAIEVKSETGKLTEEQALFLNNVIEAGGIGLVARSIDDVIKAGL